MSELHPPAAPRRHLLSIGDLERGDVERVLETARSLEASLGRDVKKLPTLRGRTVVNLFFESSTRTLASFELAAKRLSADTMSLRSAGSSVDKGESLKDTALTLSAYEPDVIVVRHPSIGAAHLVARVTQAHVVNAGDSKHQHPTQALLDLHTMREALGRLEGLHVAIVELPPHAGVKRHRHGSEQFVYVLRGSVEAELEGVVQRVAQRCALHVPAAAAHAMSAGAEGARYLVLKNKAYGIEPVPA